MGWAWPVIFLLACGNVANDRAVELFTNMLLCLGRRTAFDRVHLALDLVFFLGDLEIFTESSKTDACLA